MTTVATRNTAAGGGFVNINISHTTPGVVAALQKDGRRVSVLIAKSVTDATALVFTESRGQLSEMVYNQPIPMVMRRKRGLTKSGKKRPRRSVPAWRRTSHLLRSERSYISGSGATTVGTIDNAAKYAQARHDLDRPSPIDGKVRRAPWRRAAANRTTPRVQRLFSDAFAALEGEGS